MYKQTDLFAADGLQQTHALAVQQTSVPLSPEQRRFSQKVAKIEKITAEIKAIQKAADQFRAKLGSHLIPLEKELLELRKQLAVSLHQRLDEVKGLSRSQRSTADEIICEFLAPFAFQDDAEMKAIYEAHSRQTVDEERLAIFDSTEAALEDILGVKVDVDRDTASMEDLLSAAYERLREAEVAREEQAAARKAKRKPSAKQAKQQQEALDADVELRKVYRQLASELHPDRESDPVERDRKTALMGEVNIAYQHRDLSALLKLQLRVVQLDPTTVTRVAEEKLKAYLRLLDDQIAALQNEFHAVRQRIGGELGLGPFVGAISEKTLKSELNERLREARREVAALQADMRAIGDKAGLKRWLNEMREHLDEAALLADMPFGFPPGF